MTVIDQSLARGLRKDFWRFVEEQANQTRLILPEIFKRYNSKKPYSEKVFRRFVDDFRDSVPASTLILTKLEGRRQFVACVFLENRRDQPINEWSENVLVGSRLMLYREPGKGSAKRSFARIGEHAIERLFQRSNARTKPVGGFDFGAYSMDVKSALAWAEVLWCAVSALRNLEKDERLRLFAPTPYGAFLGQMSSDRMWVDFRTFVPIERMRREQQNLWAALRDFEEKVGLECLGLIADTQIRVHSPSMKTIINLWNILNDFRRLLFHLKKKTGLSIHMSRWRRYAPLLSY